MNFDLLNEVPASQSVGVARGFNYIFTKFETAVNQEGCSQTCLIVYQIYPKSSKLGNLKSRSGRLITYSCCLVHHIFIGVPLVQSTSKKVNFSPSKNEQNGR